jgi:hypothetical protein
MPTPPQHQTTARDRPRSSGANDVARSPSVRNAIVAASGLIVVMCLFVTAYAGAFANPKPHAIPVAVLAPTGLTRTLESTGALQIDAVPTPSEARRLIEDRTVYGALIMRRSGSLDLQLASGAGHSVAAVLTTLATAVADRSHVPLQIEDLAPLSRHDPSGSVEFYVVVFLGIAASLGAMVLGRVLGAVRSLSRLWRRVAFLAGYTAVLSAAFVAVVDGGFGALVGHTGLLFLVLWVDALALCLAITGISARLGMTAAVAVIVAVVILGNTSSGGPVGRPLLSTLYSSLTPIFPQGAGLTMLRGVQYFGDRGLGAGILTAVVWGGVGLVLLISAGFHNGTNGARVRAPEVVTADAGGS